MSESDLLLCPRVVIVVKQLYFTIVPIVDCTHLESLARGIISVSKTIHPREQRIDRGQEKSVRSTT